MVGAIFGDVTMDYTKYTATFCCSFRGAGALRTVSTKAQCIIFMIFLAGCFCRPFQTLEHLFDVCDLVASCGIHGSLRIVGERPI